MPGAPRRDGSGRLDPELLRLVLITDGHGELARLERIVAAAVAGGVRCVQLREPRWTARAQLQACERLRPLLDAASGILLVNDRVDIAATGVAHGVQVGGRSIPAELVRSVLGDDPVVVYSAHDATELDLAAATRCDAATLSPVWPTGSKPGAPNLGVAAAAGATARARLPAVWLGGVGRAEAAGVAALQPPARPVGIAVRSAICSADDPQLAAADLLRAFAGADR